MIVRTDVRDNVRESNKTNNQLASTGTIAMSLPALTPGVAALGTIANGQDIYYQVNVTPGQTLDLMADFNQSAVAEFYVRYGAIPSRDQFDAVYNNITDLQQVLTVTSPGQGTEYVLLVGRQGATLDGSYSLTAETIAFGITGVSPNTISNAGTSTVVITGAMFNSMRQVSLIGPGGLTVPATSVSWKNAETLWAQLDTTGLPAGQYSLEVIQGGQTSTLAGGLGLGLTLINNDPGQLQVQFYVNSGTYRPGQSGVATAVLTNVGGAPRSTFHR